MNLKGRSQTEDVFSPSARIMQMNFDTSDMNVDTSDSCVNTLIVANFNLLSRAIQGDTQRFELIERFIKVRNLV